MIQSHMPIETQAVAAAQSVRPRLKDLMESYERSLIQAALEATAGNQRRAAMSLGLLPTTLHEKMKRLGLLRRAEPIGAEG
jgi:DNA-binding NtrC family response regulator